ncbi:MAG TPA: hypothetical protein VN658_05325 [Candidatus Acidoferrales bacterium]|nr:hypothetical protein [Candidatus Acidoferrales bacterium]
MTNCTFFGASLTSRTPALPQKLDGTPPLPLGAWLNHAITMTLEIPGHIVFAPSRS